MFKLVLCLIAGVVIAISLFPALLPLVIVLCIASPLVWIAWSKVPGNKKLHFTCPMCEGDMNTDLDPSDIEGPFEYDNNYDVMAGAACPFCKLKMDITIHRIDRVVKAFDPKWEKIKHTFEQKEAKLEDQMDDISSVVEDIEDILDDGDSIDTEINAARKKLPAPKKKLETIENQLEKLQESFYDKEERYEERQAKWQEKFYEKYEQ